MRPSANVSERAQEPPDIGVSVVILALDRTDSPDARPALRIPLVRRIRQPFLGDWALPGSRLRQGISLEVAASDALLSTTGLDARYLEQLYTFGDPGRSSSGLPMVSIAYWALIDADEARGVHEAENVQWFPVSALPPLAFDHRRIVDYALGRVRAKIGYTDIATRLVGETFTLSQLRRVYEAILDRTLDPPNFRRSILATGMLEATGERLAEGRHRPAALYRYAARGAARPSLRPAPSLRMRTTATAHVTTDVDATTRSGTSASGTTTFGTTIPSTSASGTSILGTTTPGRASASANPSASPHRITPSSKERP